jgi:hypothetical protein
VCRAALFRAADLQGQDRSETGDGILDVNQTPDPKLAETVIDMMKKGRLYPTATDEIPFPFSRIILGLGPPSSEQDRMYECERAQTAHRSTQPVLDHAPSARATAAAAHEDSLSIARC